RARPSLHRRGRGADRPPRAARPSLDARLQRSGLSDRGARAADRQSQILGGTGMDLKNSVAVVTGGNGGLGRRICHALAKAGAHIAVVYARSAGEAEEVARELRSNEVEAAAFACDVTDPSQVARLVEQVGERFGRLDILINDAAYNKAIPFRDLDALTIEEWSKILDVNLTGPMHCMKAVAPVMREQGHGRIVNIASIAGIGPTGSSIAYAVAKAGL